MQKKKDFNLIEEGLTLYSTGKFANREEAYQKALENDKKRKQRELDYKNSTNVNITITSPDGIFW